MAHERTLPPADATTLADLEFDVVRALLERHAHGPTAKARAAARGSGSEGERGMGASINLRWGQDKWKFFPSSSQ